MLRSSPRLRILVPAILVVLTAACGPAAPPSPTVPVATEQPVPSDIAYAIRQRQQFGLRADRAWVEAVSADPRARTMLLDFPMLPEEEAALEARQTTIDRVVGFVHRYTADHPEEFGGLFIDPGRHVVVTLWTAHAEERRLAILRDLGARAPLEARQSRWTERDLDALLERITADWDWMRAIGAAPAGAGVETMNGIVSVQISSANPAAPALILAHYGVGPDMLRVDSDGTGILLLQRGTVRGTVVTAEGGVPRSDTLMVSWTSDDTGDGHGDCGVGDMGYGVGDSGAFELPCAPGGWTITIKEPRDPSGNGSWTPVGSGHVIVPAGGTVALRITLDPGVGINP
jgi:hypothetical protein